jgi:hypothetical protein
MVSDFLWSVYPADGRSCQGSPVPCGGFHASLPANQWNAVQKAFPAGLAGLCWELAADGR